MASVILGPHASVSFFAPLQSLPTEACIFLCYSNTRIASFTVPIFHVKLSQLQWNSLLCFCNYMKIIFMSYALFSNEPTLLPGNSFFHLGDYLLVITCK